jgi:hypothetical protein
MLLLTSDCTQQSMTVHLTALGFLAVILGLLL